MKKNKMTPKEERELQALAEHAADLQRSANAETVEAATAWVRERESQRMAADPKGLRAQMERRALGDPDPELTEASDPVGAIERRFESRSSEALAAEGRRLGWDYERRAAYLDAIHREDTIRSMRSATFTRDSKWPELPQ